MRESARNQASGSLHISFVFGAETIEHQPLFFRYAQEIEQAECEQIGGCDDAIGDEQEMGDAEEEHRRIHRMTDSLEDACRYKAMIFAGLEGYRPVGSQIRM